MYSLLGIVFLSLVFWGIYQRWDAERTEYVSHPLRTFFYFIFSSAALIFLYPRVLEIFRIDALVAFSLICVLAITYVLYKVLKKVFKGPHIDMHIDHAYWKLLDTKYIFPKLAEIIFQQTFFGSVMLILIHAFSLNWTVVIAVIFAFILAHIPLFFLQGSRIGLTYLIWSIIGAPVFTFVLISSGSIWYTVTVHMFFYTILSATSWMASKVNYDN